VNDAGKKKRPDGLFFLWKWRPQGDSNRNANIFINQ
jgi:hypothetical protein